MFLTMERVHRETFTAHGSEYELLLFRIHDTGDLRLFVSKGGFGVGPSFTATDAVLHEARHQSDADAIELLIAEAKDDIRHNESDEY